MNEAIKLATKGGYNSYPLGIPNEIEQVVICDPLFWQALGKALGWREQCKECKPGDNPHYGSWVDYALKYFTLHITGGDVEKFWKELLD